MMFKRRYLDYDVNLQQNNEGQPSKLFLVRLVQLRVYLVAQGLVSNKKKLLKLYFHCIILGTQALVRAGSNHSSISTEDADGSPTDLPVIGKARALVDYTPSPYDKEALKFKVVHCNKFY